MIITQTPFRMSFFGGGTDMESFFRENGGSVLSTTFDKYCYVNVRHLPRFFDYSTELSYSKTERVTSIDDIQHPAIRNAMKMLDMHEIRLTYEADLPARSGLGTSSSFAVGMLNAFYALKGKYADKKKLADEAIYLERNLCQEAGGWQDQIAASFGGFNRINFNADGYEVLPVIISPERKKQLNQNLMMFFTGFTRFSSEVQKANAADKVDKTAQLREMLSLVDDANHIIMDYSIHDAIEAGFNHVVFIIRKDIEKEFKDVIGDRIATICSSHNVTVDYAFQDINDIPGELPAGRTKPWGTGQAVLAAKNVIETPFIVINADDYYGKEGFKAVHEYLVNGGKSCMAGFVLKNTLSDNGGVTRGICKMDENGNLTEVVETKNIVKTANGAEADDVVINTDSLVSMNMWGLTPDFLEVLEEGFKEFFEKEVPSNPLKAEYLIPIFIGELLEQGKMFVKVLKTNDTWYGMTYHEDVVFVKESFRKMLENGVYKADLFSDL